jgi:putative transposase
VNEIYSHPPRLPNFDYTQPGAYFITINSYNRINLFGKTADNSVILNEFGLIASSCWQEIPKHFPFTELDEFIVMPNHLHGIIWIISEDPNNSGDTACRVSTDFQQEKFGKSVKGSIPTIIRSHKSAVTRLIRKSNKGMRVWQSNYYEHVLRNNDDLDKTREYIHHNALNRDDI